jgi:rSAM/selenodomain-associated transferase 2
MISVIIPTLDEEACLGRCIESVRSEGPSVEIIVADGGSRDRTSEVAGRFPGVKIIRTERGRGSQMNAGASHAGGDILLFLHADTVLERGWMQELSSVLGETSVIGGAFTFAIDSPLPKYRMVEAWVAMRCRVFRLPYGDQAIFIKKDIFRRLGGYQNIPLMEDVDLVRQMKRTGEVILLEKKAVTSGRRWVSKGLLRTAAINQMTMLLYLLGVSPQRLAKLYYR